MGEITIPFWLWLVACFLSGWALTDIVYGLMGWRS